MTYEEFEWQILRMVYEQGLTRLSPSYLGYALQLPHEVISSYLERAMDQGVIEPLPAEMGNVEYCVPGATSPEQLPTPIWKQQRVDPNVPSPLRSDSSSSPLEQVASGDGVVESLSGEEALKSAVVTYDASADRPQSTSAPAITSSLNDSKTLGHGKRSSSPPTLRAHVRSRGDGDTDGSLHHVVQARGVKIDRRAVVGYGATTDDGASASSTALAVITAPPAVSPTTALVPAGAQGALMSVERDAYAFCDASRTIFMRQIRVHGVKSEQALRQQIAHLFESFGYKRLKSDSERMRFERGSVGFVLALVPLFVLVVPLFVYLFLYCMGRSTIQQEPLELDVNIRQSQEMSSSYDIDLTFIGLHGIVLGAADQRVLNQEIDTLSDELSWALAAS